MLESRNVEAMGGGTNCTKSRHSNGRLMAVVETAASGRV